MKEYGCILKCLPQNKNKTNLVLLVSYMKNTYQGQLIWEIFALINDSNYSLSSVCSFLFFSYHFCLL